MSTTTDVVKRTSLRETYRRRGYFFREAAMLTIGLGVIIHLYRVIFGDDVTMRYVATPTTDKILLVPMTYAGITGILLLVQHRVRFANKRHRALFTGSVVYIAGSVPLHIYCSYIIWDTTLMTWFPMWFSYFLLIVVYPVFLTLFWRLQYRD
jgi:multisubunit Na+/H+ antiporter MnhF subunit